MNSNRTGNRSELGLHRAISTIVRTTLVVVLIGAAASFTLRPTYQCRVKMLVGAYKEQQVILDSANPLSGLLDSPDLTMADQIEIMNGDRIISDACRDADIPSDSVTMTIRQVPGTSVVEIITESATASYAERLAKTFPNTYMGYATGNRRNEITNAYSYANTRLKEENDRLMESEIRQEQFVVQNSSDTTSRPYARRMREMQRDIDLHRGTVDMLSKSIEDLRLRSKMVRDPILVISPAKQAVQTSPGQARYIINATAIGLILGLFAAGLQFFLGPKRA